MFLVGGIGVPVHLYQIRLLIGDNSFVQVEGVLSMWPKRGRGFHSAVRERLGADGCCLSKGKGKKGVWALIKRK
jgi:hypothetical protein